MALRRGTLKPAVVRAIFLERFDVRSGTLSDPLVTMPQLQAKILELELSPEQVGPDGVSPNKLAELGLPAHLAGRAGLSVGNPANFVKDIVRSPNRNDPDYFPPDVFSAGYTIQQEVGQGSVFTYVLVAEGQTVPFPERVPDETLFAAVHVVQSISINPVIRRIGRKDESMLARVLVDLQILETHLALYSPREVVSLEPLQTNVKLRRAEIDMLHVGTLGSDDPEKAETFLVSTEIKQKNQVLGEEQILRGAIAARDEGGVLFGRPTTVIPFGIKVHADDQIERDGLIWVIEYRLKEEDGVAGLAVASEKMYELRPSVRGINESARRRRQS
jgi:hypothetical protein